MKKRIQKSAQGLLGDVLRKVPIGGVGEIKVPSDVRRVLFANIEKMRESALDIFAKEVARVLSQIDFQKILKDAFDNYTLKIEARVKLEPKGSKASKKDKK
ncbi:MAG: hypothetical protein M9962_02915 [Oligoflexia bacterium]|nr:hypothetical protein [Oligoflexia bacterium]